MSPSEKDMRVYAARLIVGLLHLIGHRVYRLEAYPGNYGTWTPEYGWWTIE